MIYVLAIMSAAILVLVLRTATITRKLRRDRDWFQQQYRHYLAEHSGLSLEMAELKRKTARYTPEVMESRITAARLEKHNAELLQELEQSRGVIAGMMAALSDYLTNTQPHIEAAANDNPR